MTHFKYKNLAALFAVICLAGLLCELQWLSPAHAAGLVVAWQLSALMLSPQQAMCFDTVLTPAQIKEFGDILNSFKGYEGLFKELFEMSKQEGGFAAIRQLPELLKTEKTRGDELEKTIKKLQKRLAAAQGEGQVRYVNGVPFVTDDCARAMTALFIMECARSCEGRPLMRIAPNAQLRASLLGHAAEVLGMEQKAAMTTAELPLPINYVPQISELVFTYGQARQFATVYPLGAGSTKLPRLKAGEDDFGFLGTGMAAGMGQAIGEKKVGVELVTLDPSKAGGIIRMPTELEENTFVQAGQFLARYIARQFAKLEDKCLFIGDGGASYGGITGVGPYCTVPNGYLLQLAAGKTKPSDITLDDLRNMRAKVSAAILAGGFDAAYYLHPTFEPFLRGLNKDRNNLVYEVVNGKPTLDGWPVRYIAVSQPYTTAAAPSAYLAFFGALRYWYLGERGGMRVELSKEVFFATDELALRALEEVDIDTLAVDAMSATGTPAA